MRVFLAGIGCVGKTTIGAKLADLLGYRFFDADAEIERFFGMSVEQLRSRHPGSRNFRTVAARALAQLLSRDGVCDCVIALPPSGLMGGYWSVVGRVQDAVIVILRDTVENIFQRITFYDIDSRPIRMGLTERETCVHLRQIKMDMTYFRRSFERAHISVDIAGCDPDEAARRVGEALTLACYRPDEVRRKMNSGVQPGESRAMARDKRGKEAARERRIVMEIVVDAYDSGERAMGWYYYLDERLNVPFQARCRRARPISPLKPGEKVQVIGMAPEEECKAEMFVWVEWKREKIAVPLAQLESLSKDRGTQEAVGDWHYWVDHGYEF
jgi:shikimate kinase